jgi:hypothetical protein
VRQTVRAMKSAIIIEIGAMSKGLRPSFSINEIEARVLKRKATPDETMAY